MKRVGPGFVLIAIALVGCGSPGSEGDNTSTGPQSSFRHSIPANVFPNGDPPFACGPLVPDAHAVMQRLNGFWQSGARACTCVDDLAWQAGCRNNAFVPAIGYIFFDPVFLFNVANANQSTLPADSVIAHEFGHNIQLANGLDPHLQGKLRELHADCLGGYYLGFLVASGQVLSSDVAKTFQFACSSGEQANLPWWDKNNHGSCEERVASLQQGIDAYFNDALPVNGCPVTIRGR